MVAPLPKYIVKEGQDAIWEWAHGLLSKNWDWMGDGVEWMDSGLDTPQTVMTTGAPAVLTTIDTLRLKESIVQRYIGGT